jgi:uncharacterized Zn-finger protein
MKPFETIEVQEMEVACDGGAGGLGHPRVFLHLDKTSHRIQCPYCSRLYVLKESDDRKTA